MQPAWTDDDPPPLPPDAKRNTHSKNAPAFDVCKALYDLPGIDLTAVDGLHANAAQIILSTVTATAHELARIIYHTNS